MLSLDRPITLVLVFVSAVLICFWRFCSSQMLHFLLVFFLMSNYTRKMI